MWLNEEEKKQKVRNYLVELDSRLLGKPLLEGVITCSSCNTPSTPYHIRNGGDSTADWQLKPRHPYQHSIQMTPSMLWLPSLRLGSIDRSRTLARREQIPLTRRGGHPIPRPPATSDIPSMDYYYQGSYLRLHKTKGQESGWLLAACLVSRRNALIDGSDLTALSPPDQRPPARPDLLKWPLEVRAY